MSQESIEQWADIEGYEGYYQVSSLGRIKSMERYIQDRFGMKSPYRIPPKVLKPKKAPNGYMFVHLSKEGKVEPRRIHRMVAEAFIPNPYRLPSVNHKNEDKTDNRVENLEWCTQAYNNEYGTRTQRSQLSQKYRRPVAMYAMDGRLLRTFPTVVEAARYVAKEITDMRTSVKIANNNIRAVCQHKPNRHIAYGYLWEFVAVNPHGKNAV